jgi:hypothetical protein
VTEAALVPMYIRDIVLTDRITLLFMKPQAFMPIVLRDTIAARH